MACLDSASSESCPDSGLQGSTMQQQPQADACGGAASSDVQAREEAGLRPERLIR